MGAVFFWCYMIIFFECGAEIIGVIKAAALCNFPDRKLFVCHQQLGIFETGVGHIFGKRKTYRAFKEPGKVTG